MEPRRSFARVQKSALRVCWTVPKCRSRSSAWDERRYGMGILKPKALVGQTVTNALCSFHGSLFTDDPHKINRIIEVVSIG